MTNAIVRFKAEFSIKEVTTNRPWILELLSLLEDLPRHGADPSSV